MAARIPQDVDLEDRLLYGLTPLRFAYLALAGATALMVWSSHGPPLVVRIVLALLLGGAGAALAWARWHGRAIDEWAVDLAVFLARNYRVEVRWPTRTSSEAKPDGQVNKKPKDLPRAADPTRPLTLTVTAQRPGAGARSVAVELAVALAHGGDRVMLVDHSERLGVATRLTDPLPPGLTVANPVEHPNGTDPRWIVRLLAPDDSPGSPDAALFVADHHAAPAEPNGQDHARLILNRGPRGNGCLPFDPGLPAAQSAGIPLLVCDPKSPFSMAIGRLAGRIRKELVR